MAFAAQQTKRDILTFESGHSYELALKYPIGKEVSNGRIMFSTVTDEVFFIDPSDADKIYDLQLRPQEKFRLVKQGNSRNSVIEVSKIQARAESTPAAPVVAAMPALVTPQQPQDNSLSRIMASSYISAIDALMIARDYADAKGIPFRLSAGEIRSAAHCVFIAASRMQQGGR